MLEQTNFDRVINKKALLEYFPLFRIFSLIKPFLEGIHLLQPGHYATLIS